MKTLINLFKKIINSKRLTQTAEFYYLEEEKKHREQFEDTKTRATRLVS